MSLKEISCGDKLTLAWLDWLRFIFALLVVLSHVRGQFFSEWSELEESSQTIAVFLFFAVTRLGDLAVMAFFVISGFLVGGKLIERIKDGSFHLKRYAIDRFTRIYVPLVPALVLTFLVGSNFGEQDLNSKIFGSMLSIQGSFTGIPEYNGPLWSLTYEVWFYVIAGASAMLLTSSLGVLSFLVLIVAFCIFTSLEAHLFFVWAFGAFAYCIDYKSDVSRRLASIASGILLCLGLVISQLGSAGQFSGLKSLSSAQDIGWGMFGAGLAIALPIIINAKTPNTGIFLHIYRKGTPLAAFSYTAYLFHYPILYMALDILEHDRFTTVNLYHLALFSALVLFLLLFCSLAYLPFEKQTNRYRFALQAMAVKSR